MNPVSPLKTPIQPLESETTLMNASGLKSQFKNIAASAVKELKATAKLYKIAFQVLIIDVRASIHNQLGHTDKAKELKGRAQQLEWKTVDLTMGTNIKGMLKAQSINDSRLRHPEREASFRNEVAYLRDHIVVQAPGLRATLDKIKETADKLDQPSADPKKLAQLKQGICCGMCMDLASKLAHKDIHSPNFEQELLEVLQDFKYGGSTAAVANQFVYAQLIPGINIQKKELFGLNLNRLEKAGVLSPLQKEMVKLLIVQGLMHDKEEPNLDALHARIKEGIGASGLEAFKQLHQLMVNNQETVTPELMNKWLREASIGKKLTPEEGDQLAYVAKWVLSFKEYLSPSQLDLPIKSAPEAKLSDLKSRVAVYFKKGMNKVIKEVDKVAVFFLPPVRPADTPKTHFWKDLIELQAVDLKQDFILAAIAQTRGLLLGPVEQDVGIRGIKTDRDYLAQFRSLDTGVHFLGMRTATSGHATLYIKTPFASYFFDPNFGVFKGELDDPTKPIQTILSLYDTPRSEGAGTTGNVDHQLHLRKALPLPRNR